MGGRYGSPMFIEKSVAANNKNGIDIKAIGIAVNTVPKMRQFLAFLESSYFIAKYAIKPPIKPPNIGRIYHKSLLCLVTMLLNTCVISITN